MAELDYAFLAEYATVQNGTLTAVGGSFINIRGQVPFHRSLAVAGRIRASEDTAEFEVSVEFKMPGSDPALQVAGMVTPSVADHAYDGKLAVLFVVNQTIAFAEPGLAVVEIRIDGDHARTLKFDVLDS